MSNAAKKPDEKELDPKDEENEEEEDDDEESEDDEDDDGEEDDEDDEDIDDETALAKEICLALRDALESGVSVMVVGKKLLLDLDDDSHWELRLKRRD